MTRWTSIPVIVGIGLLVIWRPILLLALVLPGMVVLPFFGLIPPSFLAPFYFGPLGDNFPIAIIIITSATFWAAVWSLTLRIRRRYRKEPRNG